ncbi:MAGUK p55 subfamily member 7-like [Anguilla anguilla]|uniref:MAGUK p55 subfamily member 7-like n=1 Tax=Anguilla anguilla TaxID=7936 RepID=UPI0015ADDE0E|nr:MAGUK p55 subfamily member 7-like [Anguilla anguilla]
MPANDTGTVITTGRLASCHGSIVTVLGRHGVYELLAALASQIQSHVTRQDCTFLQSMLRDRSLLPLLKIHERLKQYQHQSPPPVLVYTGALAYELSRDLQSKADREEVKELSDLLANPHVKSLFSVHDAVAQERFGPTLPPLPEDLGEQQDPVKIIQLVKSTEPLGATVKRDQGTGAIVVARILRGGAADRSGLIHEGDELREVNGVLMDDKRPEDVAPVVVQSRGAVTFKVVPGIKEDSPGLEEEEEEEEELFVRALFDYEPRGDAAIPCEEAGLAFGRGAVLQVVSWAEPVWWQARLHGSANPRAGLVPSKQLQERRFLLQRATEFVQQKTSKQRSEGEGEADYGAISGIHIAGLRRSFRLSRRNWRAGLCECGRSKCYDLADAPTYEEVVPYRRQPEAPYRLVLLVGPRGVGVSEMKRRLLISDPQHFGVTVPYTTRAKRGEEKDGVEYKFVSKPQFEADIIENKFIEHGDYRGHYYGTSLDSVRSILQGNKVCLLDVPPHSIQRLRTAEFKPYVVFVKPPPMEELRLSRRNAKVARRRDGEGSAELFTEEDFQEMIDSAQEMEDRYGHLFEKTIVNEDMAFAFRELSLALEKLETEIQWIPKSWVSS